MPIPQTSSASPASRGAPDPAKAVTGTSRERTAALARTKCQPVKASRPRYSAGAPSGSPGVYTLKSFICFGATRRSIAADGRMIVPRSSITVP